MFSLSLSLFLFLHPFLPPGKPPPSLIWYRDNQLIDDSFTVDNESERVENILTIENLTRDYLYSVLTCRAHNHPTLPAISASTRLDLYSE